MEKNKQFINEIAKEFDIPIFLSEAVCNSVFKFVRQEMATKNMEGVMLPYFGKFIVKPERKYKVKEGVRKRNERLESLEEGIGEG